MAESATRTIELAIVTPSALLYEGQVTAAQVPLHDGLIGVLPGHAPLIGLLGFGLMTLTEDGQRREFVIDGGFVEVTPARVTVLANGGENIESVDPDTARKDLEEALAQHAHGETQVRRRADRIAAARTRVQYGRPV